MSEPLTMDLPGADKTALDRTDALKYALIALLMQKSDERKMVAVQYESCSLTNSEQMYSILEYEAATVIFALKHVSIII